MSREHLDAAGSRHRRSLADQPALADPGRPHDADDVTGSIDDFVENPGDRVEFPRTSHEGDFVVSSETGFANSQEAAGAHRIGGSFDVHQFTFTQCDGVLHQMRGRLAEHHSAGWGDGLHPLRHADLLADCRVTWCVGADFTSDDLT
jgi:hypothetical protein